MRDPRCGLVIGAGERDRVSRGLSLLVTVCSLISGGLSYGGDGGPELEVLDPPGEESEIEESSAGPSTRLYGRCFA